MRAVQISKPGGEFGLVNREIPVPLANEVLIRVEACGVCHGEAVIKEGTFHGLIYPRIPGHEVIGTIVQSEREADQWKTGDRVGIGWHAATVLNAGHAKKATSGIANMRRSPALHGMAAMPNT